MILCMPFPWAEFSGTSEEIEENAEKKNKFDFVKNFIDKISKSKSRRMN